MSLSIRLATKLDCDPLWHLEQRVFDPHEFFLISKKQFAYLLTKGNCKIFVAELGAQLVGALVLLFRKTSKLGRLYSFSVDPDFQGKNIGHQLFQEAQAYLQNQNFQGLLCETRQDKAKLIALYKNLGFTQICRLDNYYPDGHTGVKFRKIFSPKEDAFK